MATKATPGDEAQQQQQRPAFRVQGDADAVDLTRPPTTAAEYLLQVRKEASQTPDIVVAPGVHPAAAAAQEEGTEAAASSPTTRSPHRPHPGVSALLSRVAKRRRAPSAQPSALWQDCELMRFQRLQLVVARQAALGKGPPLKKFDKAGWKRFCLGGARQQPLLSVVTSMSQNTIRCLLHWFAAWLEEGFTHQHGLWIYALLVCLESPVPAAVTATQRRIVTLCRQHAEKDGTMAAAEHLLSTLITRKFGQLDLI